MVHARGLWVACMILAGGAQLHAAIIFQDDFNRSGSLNGSTPSFGSAAQWTATASFTTNGAQLDTNNTFLQAAYLPLPVPIESGYIYTLYATTYHNPGPVNTPADPSGFVMFGFFDSAPAYAAGFSVDNGNAIAIGPRDGQSTVEPLLNGHINGDVVAPSGTNGVTFGVQLRETAPNSWVANVVDLTSGLPGTFLLTPGGNSVETPVSLGSISTIGFISAASYPPYIDNLTLDRTPVAGAAVPEPLSILTWAGVIASSAVFGVRRRQWAGQ